MTFPFILVIIEVFELPVVFITNKQNKYEKLVFLEKTRNKKIIIYNGKLIIMYLPISK